MTEAEENLGYWQNAYADDLAKGRDPTEFEMRLMWSHIQTWKEAVDKEICASQQLKEIGRGDDR